MAKISKLVILLLAIVGFISADAAIIRRETDREEVDRLLFDSPMEVFLEAVKEARNPALNYSSDGCSKVVDKPLGFDFLPSCERHDFGYRNYKKLGLLNDTNRERINKNFRKDMEGICNSTSDEDVDYRYPIASVISKAMDIAVTLLDFLLDDQSSGGDSSGYDQDSGGDPSGGGQDSGGDPSGDGQDSGGNDSYRYSPRDVCEMIADSYYDGVTIDGWIRSLNGACGYGSARGNVYFWGTYSIFFGLVFGYGWW